MFASANGPGRAGGATDAGHMPQLDALRAIAVLGVLIQHFFPRWSKTFHWGDIGVQLFFVLSGFLITGILLRCRALAEGGEGYGYVLRHFYARRALRLFPAFYLSILLAWMTARHAMPDGVVWHMLYLSNWKMTFQAGWDGMFAHYWSLSVEEQFYLIWPCLILLLPRTMLVPVIALAVGIAPAWRAVASVTSVNTIATFIPTPACLDALGCGSLLAILHARRLADGTPDTSWRRPMHVAVLCAAVPLFLAVAGLQFFWKGYNVFATIFNSLLALLFMLLVDKAAVGFGGWGGRLMSSRALTYPGRISYGIYVYHLLVAQWTYQLAVYYAIPYEHGSVAVFAVQTAATLLVAALSWHLIEKPFNSLKDYLPYARTERRHVALPWQPAREALARLARALARPYWWQRIGGAAAIVVVLLGMFALNSDAEPPQLRELSGTLTRVGEEHYLDEHRLKFGAAPYLAGAAVADLNGDGKTATLAEEIAALLNQPVEITARPQRDGSFEVYAVNGIFYRPASGPPPWAAHASAATEATPQ